MLFPQHGKTYLTNVSNIFVAESHSVTVLKKTPKIGSMISFPWTVASLTVLLIYNLTSSSVEYIAKIIYQYVKIDPGFSYVLSFVSVVSKPLLHH